MSKVNAFFKTNKSY